MQNKISVDGRETYEGLFKEYWEIIKANEGLTIDNVSAALTNNKKVMNSLLRRNVNEGEEEKQNDSVSWDGDEDYMGKLKSTKRKMSNSLEFLGWGSKPLLSFLASIGKYHTEPLTQWCVRSLIYEYIKEKNLYHPKDKKKFLPDEKLFPIFRKKVVSQNQIYPLLEFHFAEKLDDRDGEENNDQTPCMESRLSGLIGKPLLKKGDLFIKASCFVSISASNINLIYLKRSLVLELSKQLESFMGKVVGAFVRVKEESSDCRQMKSHHLVRVVGSKLDIFDNLPFPLLFVSFLKSLYVS